MSSVGHQTLFLAFGLCLLGMAFNPLLVHCHGWCGLYLSQLSRTASATKRSFVFLPVVFTHLVAVVAVAGGMAMEIVSVQSA